MTKDKGINLGAMQIAFEEAKKRKLSAKKAFDRADEEKTAADIAADKARDDLTNATKAVLN